MKPIGSLWKAAFMVAAAGALAGCGWKAEVAVDGVAARQQASSLHADLSRQFQPDSVALQGWDEATGRAEYLIAARGGDVPQHEYFARNLGKCGASVKKYFVDGRTARVLAGVSAPALPPPPPPVVKPPEAVPPPPPPPVVKPPEAVPPPPPPPVVKPPEAVPPPPPPPVVKPPEAVPPPPPPPVVKPPEAVPPPPPVVAPPRPQPILVALTVVDLADVRAADALCDYLGKLPGVQSVKLGAFSGGKGSFTIAYAPGSRDFRPSLTAGLEKHSPRGIEVTSYTATAKPIRVEGRVNPPAPIRVELTVSDVPSEADAAALRDHMKGQESVLAATLVSCKVGVAIFTAFVPHGTPDVRKVFEAAAGKFGRAGVTVTDCVEAGGLVKVAARMNPVVPVPTLGAVQKAAVAKEAADKLRLVRILCEETLELSGGSAKTAAASRVLAEALQKAGYRVVAGEASFFVHTSGAAKLNEKFGNFYSFDASLAGRILDPARLELAAVTTAAKRGERLLREEDAANSAVKAAAGELAEKLLSAADKAVAAARPVVLDCEVGELGSLAAAEQFRAALARLRGVHYASLEGWDARTYAAKYELLHDRGDKEAVDALRKAAAGIGAGKVRGLAARQAAAAPGGAK